MNPQNNLPMNPSTPPMPPTTTPGGMMPAAQLNANLMQTPQPAQNPMPPVPTGTPEGPKKARENPLSTQATMLFSELRDGLIIMRDGSFRAVVACRSINFDLMSSSEREGIEYSYQNFLNSLTFSIQILIRSQRIDISPYISKLTELRRNNENMLLGVLMDDYISFIQELSREANIMDKSFFVVIPYYSSSDTEKSIQETKNLFKTFSKNKMPEVTRINRDVYNQAIDELNKRVESVVSGLFNIGIQSVRLNTRELSELLYNFNNPDTAVREPLIDFGKVATTYVKRGTKEETEL